MATAWWVQWVLLCSIRRQLNTAGEAASTLGISSQRPGGTAESQQVAIYRDNLAAEVDGRSLAGLVSCGRRQAQIRATGREARWPSWQPHAMGVKATEPSESIVDTRRSLSWGMHCCIETGPIETEIHQNLQLISKSYYW